MPSGIPPPTALNGRSVCAFTLDTSVVEAAGYRFNEGQLKNLSGQVPPWLELWLPDIVVREITKHRIEPVGRAVQQIQTAINELTRQVGPEVDLPSPPWLIDIRPGAVNLFDEQFQSFRDAHRGVVLEPAHESLGVQLFDMYFQGLPPFGGGKDKKHEFPDAASLLMIEYEAKRRAAIVIAVSKDAGWHAYAKLSRRVYCVSSPSDLVALFLANSPESREIQNRLRVAFANPNKSLLKLVNDALKTGIHSIPWRINVPSSYRHAFDASVIEAKVNGYEFRPENIGVWITSQKEEHSVAELSVDADLTLRVRAYAFRYGDQGEKVDISDSETVIEHHCEVKLRLELSGPFNSKSTTELISNISLGDDPLEITVKRSAFGKEWLIELGEFYFESEWGDDIPF